MKRHYRTVMTYADGRRTESESESAAHATREFDVFSHGLDFGESIVLQRRIGDVWETLARACARRVKP